jgi:hypothetical protein
MLTLVDRATHGISGYAYAQPVIPTFDFFGVADGEYDVIAEAGPRVDEKSTSLPKRVLVEGADISGVEITMTPLASVTGKIVLEKAEAACIGSPKVILQEATIELLRGGSPIRQNRLETVPDSGNEFSIGGIQPGRYYFGGFLPGESLYVKAITAPTRDLSKEGLTLSSGDRVTGITVTFVEGAASVKGSIINAGSRRFRVHLVPREGYRAEGSIFYYEGLAGADGSFSLSHIGPGTYWVVAQEIQLNEPLDQSRVAWDSKARLKLRAIAQAAGSELKLEPCQRVNSYIIQSKRAP